MSRYHEIVKRYEGECQQCGACCGDCEDLYRLNGRWLCRSHPRKPKACRSFPKGYAVELVPPECAFRITETRRVDELFKGQRIRAAHRTGLALVPGVGEDEESFPDLYDLQSGLVTRWPSRVYRPSPSALAASIRELADELARLESDHKGKRSHLENPTWFQAERTCKRLLQALLAYAERRDIVIGDLFTKDEDA